MQKRLDFGVSIVLTYQMVTNICRAFVSGKYREEIESVFFSVSERVNFSAVYTESLLNITISQRKFNIRTEKVKISTIEENDSKIENLNQM